MENKNDKTIKCPICGSLSFGEDDDYENCDVCGWEYDEEEGYPEGGIAPGTKWEDVPEDFECPLCLVGKDQFVED